MFDVKAKIGMQVATASRIESLNERFTHEILTSRKKSSITTARRELDNLWAAYQAMHLEIYGELEDTERSPKNPYMKAYEATAEMQLMINRKLDGLWEELEDEAIARMHALQLQQPVNPPRSRLPQIKIEEFSGDYHRWTSFKSLFTSLIHAKVEIPNVEKFHYLLSFLTGDAMRVVNHYAITAENYVTAWAELQNRKEP